ncbi:MAG: hypothetical protein KGO50_01600, partial [Myxococcales bacterium]|nr:hypothetical protein [Myxococcales bacterium]
TNPLSAGTIARLRTLSEQHHMALLILRPGPGAVWYLDWRATARPGRRLVSSVLDLQVPLDAPMATREAYALRTVELFLSAIDALMGTPSGPTGNGTLHGQAMAEVRA